MTLRAKLALVLASLAALAAIGVGLLSYDATSTRMLAEIDRTLLRSSRARNDLDDDNLPNPGGGPPGRGGDGGVQLASLEVFQVLNAAGQIIIQTDGVTLPVNAAELAVARTGRGEVLRTVTGSDKREFRVRTQPRRIGAFQFGRDLSEMNRVLHDLRSRILLVGGVAVVLAAFAGWFAARGLTKSLSALTEAASEVSSTGRLDIDVAAGGRDEVGRLGTAFSTMLTALNTSREDQRRLVQDAGHELRTPLTSLRTNVDVLRRHGDLPAEMRAKVLDDLDIEVAELSSLVEEVVAVGSGRSPDEPSVEVRIADVVESAAGRVGRRTGRTIDVTADSSVVLAQRSSLDRAITNLLDNAAKFDNSAEPIEISVANGRVAVRDHGPGIAPEDLDLVFDRFYRAVAARSQPGSGLGLSIVTEVAAAHGGTTFAANHPERGAIVGFELPIVERSPLT
ncbi:MAG: HAMP domain-containing sensor histidine kinase [Actinobacteria bacterium]|nr:HAMP domain-containing sensor histidine kinase [Actinomycetota bacterium]